VSDVPVLVLGTEVTALGAIRALAEAGVTAYVLARDPGVAGASRWYRRATGDAAAAEADLAAYLSRLPWPRAVLLPCSDHWTRQVATLEPGTRFPGSVACLSALDVLIDKGRFAGALADAGIDHPFTRVLQGPDDLVNVPEAVLPTGFLKPRDSQSFFAAYGVKAFRVTDHGDADRRTRELEAAGHAMMFQEYIPGPPQQHVFVDGFADRDGRILARFARRRLRMYPADFGNSSYLVSIAPSDVTPAITGLERLFRHIGYRGIFSAEFKQDPRDGRFKILEVNTRPWWQVDFAASCGVNVCVLAYRDALGLPLDLPHSYAVGRAWVYPYYDVHACRELRRRGEVTLLAWLRSWLVAQQPVFRWRDPGPGVRAAWRWALGFLRRRVGRRWARR
jgi:D-aspartate ligase